MNIATYLLLAGLLGAVSHLNGQSTLEYHIQEALELESQHKDSLALICFEEILRTAPDHIDANIHASRMASNLGGRSLDNRVKKTYVQKSISYAQKSIHLSPKSKEAHLNYVIALGLAADLQSSATQKLRNARLIKEEVDLLLWIDPFFAPGHYAMGKWHLALSSLSWFEKMACDVLLGGMPEGVSITESIKYFNNAIELQPQFILFHYNKALALKQAGRLQESLEVLRHAVALPLMEPDDQIRKNNCITLMEELKSIP